MNRAEILALVQREVSSWRINRESPIQAFFFVSSSAAFDAITLSIETHVVGWNGKTLRLGISYAIPVELFSFTDGRGWDHLHHRLTYAISDVGRAIAKRIFCYRPAPTVFDDRDVAVAMIAEATSGPPNVAERLEQEGTKELVGSDVVFLPTDMRPSRVAFEERGILFGESPDGDSLFVEAFLPDSWKVEEIESRKLKLVDGKGDLVASIFYKASPHDRQAFMALNETPTIIDLGDALKRSMR